MKRFLIGFTVTIVTLFLIIGCEKNTSSALSDEQLEISGIEDMVLDENNEYLIDWGIDDGDENNMFDGFSTFASAFSLPKVMTPLNNVVRFGRKIDKRFPRTIVVRRISPDSILVAVERVLSGKFVIFDKITNSSTNTDTIGITRKPLRHIVKRKTIFVKRNVTDAEFRFPRKRFRLAQVSLTLGKSKPVNTIRLEKISIKSASGYDTTFTDPLNTMLNIPEDLPTFIKGEKVTITVLVSNSSTNLLPDSTGATETLLLHFGINRQHHARKRFEFKGVDPETGFNIYEGTWTVHEPAYHLFHAVVDAIDNGTIYDTDNETYPYNSTTWGYPYRVVLAK